MARGRGRPGMGEWVQSLGEQIGTQLGQIIAQSVQRTIQVLVRDSFGFPLHLQTFVLR